MDYEMPYNSRRAKYLKSEKENFDKQMCKDYAENRIQDYIATLEDETARLQKEKQELLESLKKLRNIMRSSLPVPIGIEEIIQKYEGDNNE